MLSEGLLLKIIKENEKPDKPIFQLLGFKLISGVNGSASRYRIVISDGKISTSSAMLATQLCEKVDNGEITDNCIVQLNNYVCNTVDSSEKGQKKVLVIFHLEVLQEGNVVGDILGDPKPFKPEMNQDQRRFAEAQPGPSSACFDDCPPRKKLFRTPNFKENISKCQSHPTQSSFSSSQGSVHEHSPGVKTFEISELLPFINRWRIKARVLSKSSKKTWSNSKGEGTYFSCMLSDKSGQIKATAFRSEVDRFWDIIEENKCYYFSKAQIKTTNKKFNISNHDYELVFLSNTIIEPSEDDSDEIPGISYDFVKFSELLHVEPGKIIDIIGIVKEVMDVSHIVTRKTNKQVEKREIIMFDDTTTCTSVTLWGDVAERNDFSNNTIIAIGGIKVSDFNGRSLTCISSSHIKKNPDISRAHELRGWHLNCSKNVQYKEYKTERINSSYDNNSLHFKFLRSLKEKGFGVDKPEYYNCIAFIMNIRLRNSIYRACPKDSCTKKLTEIAENEYRCDKCRDTTKYFQYRLMLEMNIADHTHQIWVTVFHETAQKILGKSVNELSYLYERNKNAYADVLTDAAFRHKNLRLRTKMEHYQDEYRLKTICVGVELVDYRERNKSLISDIDKLLGRPVGY